MREGAQVAIVGKPNVGKSSVFNALVGTSRAIVTDVPGTTRDLVTEVVDLEGLRITLVDTAGLRETTDRVEAEGVERAPTGRGGGGPDSRRARWIGAAGRVRPRRSSRKLLNTSR